MSLLNDTFDVSVMGADKGLNVDKGSNANRFRDENQPPNDEDKSPNPMPMTKRTLFKSPSNFFPE